jgi:hypothetical protein
MFGYQNGMVDTIVESEQIAAFVNMGLGKTISTLTALLEMDAFPALVVAPARVARNVWRQEAAKWEHTKHLEVVRLTGDAKSRLADLQTPAHIFVISYENLIWLMENYDMGQFKAIVWDELSKMKHPGARRFKLMRNRMMDIPIRIGLTGTPVGNHLIDLWGEMFTVAGEKPLGPSKVQFAMQYFTAIPVGEHAKMYLPQAGAQEMIFERIKPWCFSLDPSDAPKLPPVVVNEIELELPKKARDLSAELARELRVELDSGAELLALSSGTVAQKVRQMASGAVYTDLEGRWEEIHTAKLDALEDVLDELQGEPVLCFYWYKHERERILKRFPQARELSDFTLDAWNKRKVELMIAHPASAGHGLNLQGGGHNVVWFTLPWSLELWQQSNGRLARHGQASQSVMAHVLLAGDTDDAVLSVLRSKDQMQQALLDHVRI